MNIDDYITISDLPKGLKLLRSKAFLLNEEVIIKIDEWSIRFIRPSISYNGKLYAFKRQNGNDAWPRMSISNDELPNGKFYFDAEDSNEDCLIAYFDTI